MESRRLVSRVCSRGLARAQIPAFQYEVHANTHVAG